MTPEQMEQMEAATIAAMHEQRAPVDLEYTPITAPLPELVRPAEVEALREEYSRLYIMWENAMQSLRAERARIAELEGRFADAQLEVTRERNNCAWIGERSKEQAARIAELEAQLSLVDRYGKWIRGTRKPAPFAVWLERVKGLVDLVDEAQP